MDDLLRAAGLEGRPATSYDHYGEQLILVRLEPGAPLPAWARARDGLRGRHYPVLVRSDADPHDPDMRVREDPAVVLARAAEVDVDARIDQDFRRYGNVEEMLGEENGEYYLDAYDILSFGEPDLLAILPRPEPWAALAYLPACMLAESPYVELMVAAARRWHDRFGAEPTVIDLATGFRVARRPADRASAEQLAIEHEVLAGLTAGARLRNYASVLMQIDHWRLYNRP
ncbi:DUF4253 domain-containing protein [Actinoplanes sp. HUAS TT8]|uniref:DUF4253 domain-containing protein n=1 Tax=Actinoplanes sp. HUAS TT8 TaxID=3447453 RepID=UPI003F51C81D